MTQLWQITGAALLAFIAGLVGKRKNTAETEEIVARTFTGMVTVLRSEMTQQRADLERRMDEQRAEFEHRASVFLDRIAKLEQRLAWEQSWSSWARKRLRQMTVAIEEAGGTVPPPSTPEPVWPADQGDQ